MTRPNVFFVLGDITVPNGGAHVIFDFVFRLQGAGIPARMLFASKGFHYPFADVPPNAAWSSRLMDLRDHRGRGRIGKKLAEARFSLGVESGDLPEATPAPGDIVVIPEYCYHKIAPVFPDARVVILNQDHFGLLRSWSRDPGGHVFAGAAAVLSTSEACFRAAEILNPRFHEALQLDLDTDRFPFVETKKRQIAFMPRKRGEEARFVSKLLAERLPDLPQVEIQGMSREEAAGHIGDSLFFIAFSRQEGFGLPPAEAMATGSIVTGFNGVGGAEYLTDDVAFPIPDSDVIGLVDKVVQLVAEYDEDPTRLDALRRRASSFVVKKYDKGLATSVLLAKWKGLEKHLAKVNAPDAG